MNKKTIKKAAVLNYDSNTGGAPELVAKGKGLVAERILALAREHNIPMYEDQNLVQVLDALDLNTEIPEELYRAVAQVLVFVYQLNKNGI